MKKEKDYVLSTVACQVLVSLILLGLVFGLSKTGSGAFSRLSADLLPLLKTSLTKEEADDAFKEISEVFFSDGIAEMVGGWASGFSENTENTEEETTVPESGKTTEDAGLTVTVKNNAKTDKTLISKTVNRDGKAIQASSSALPYTLKGTVYRPLSGKITSAYGERIHPVYDTDSFHSGIDIAADMGTLIRSMYDGTVVRASYDQWNGNFLEIDHGNGISTVYCHCSKLLCEVKTVVRGGEAIARVGSTGVSTGPHLHFEFRINSVSYNPIYALKSAADAV